MGYESIPFEKISLEKDIYKVLTQAKYRSRDEEVSISDLINEMLKEYLHTYILSKRMGSMVLSKDIIKSAVESMNDEQIRDASIANVERYKEGAIIEYGRPSLVAYLAMIKAFAKANKFDMDISKNPDNGNQVLIINFHMGDKFSQLKGSTYKMLLEEFVEIDRLEMTSTMFYVEFKPKKELIQEFKI